MSTSAEEPVSDGKLLPDLWESYTPEQVWGMLRAAPQVIGPWEKSVSLNQWVRPASGIIERAAYVWPGADGSWIWYLSDMTTRGGAPTLGEAMSGADRALSLSPQWRAYKVVGGVPEDLGSAV